MKCRFPKDLRRDLYVVVPQAAVSPNRTMSAAAQTLGSWGPRPDVIIYQKA